MKLLVISHTPHYRRGRVIVGWGPTVREIDHLADLFDEVVHVAPLHEEAAPESSLAYENGRVRLCAVRPSGGNTLRHKVGVLSAYAEYMRILTREFSSADVVHVRCPANISLLACALLTVRRLPAKRWIKYAGNWDGYAGEPLTYALQRWWLEHDLARAAVTINGRWPRQPGHVQSFLNPCLTTDELDSAGRAAGVERLEQPIRLLFVGQLVESKGVFRALEVMKRISREGTEVTLDFIGNGLEREALEERAAAAGLRERVTFYGWVPRTELAGRYGTAHFMIFPSETEGWPKVLSESMAYGVVPIASNVSSIPQYLDAFGIGMAVDPEDTAGFVTAVLGYVNDPARWEIESGNGRRAALSFTYSSYISAVRQLLDL